MSVISVHHLTKTFQIPLRTQGFWKSLAGLAFRKYREVRALENISFEVKEGELLGYIGPNGAGKSTTIKILSGILTPEKGNVNVFGKSPWAHRIETVGKIGVVFGQRTQLWWDLPVIESFELLRDIYRIPENQFRQTYDELVQRLELDAILDVPVRQLSLGQRMRCDLAAALLHRPKLLFLDEPTIGLDAVSKLAVRDFIRHLNKEFGVTVFLTTHDMDDIEALCKRILVLHEGTIYMDGSIEKLRAKITPERRLILDLQREYDTIHDEEARLIRQEGHRVWLSFDPMRIPTPDMIARITAKHAITDLYVENPPIEEIIAKLYGNART